MQQTDFLKIREAELSAALAYFPPGCRVLELGGGTGWQARLLAERGFQVESLDIELHAPENSFFPVQRYDGVHLPFPDESFDVVFSSNVLEHVTQRAALLQEVARVSKPGAQSIHLLPNPCWRLFTLLGFYPDKAKKAWRLLFRRGSSEKPAASAAAANGQKALRHKVLYDAPHGEFPSAVAELWFFSALFWRKELNRFGLRLEKTELAGGYWYHAYSDMSLLSLTARARIPRWLGRPCTLYLLRKQ